MSPNDHAIIESMLTYWAEQQIPSQRIISKQFWKHTKNT